jgi:Spy/CpxP family protein refolding chaperone
MMIRRFAAPLVALAVVTTTAAFAQDPGAGGAPGGGRGQGGGRGGFGGGQGRGGFGGGMFGMQQDVSLASAPINALAKALKLEDAQKTQIGEIQQALREQQQTQMREAFQSMQGGGGGFDPQAMQEMRQQMQDKAKAAGSKASKAIEALLTDDQKTAWPGVKKTWDVFQKAGLNIELGEALNLTPEQMKALADYAKSRPAPGPGGPGGGRGFGGG